MLDIPFLCEHPELVGHKLRSIITDQDLWNPESHKDLLHTFDDVIRS